MGTTTDANDDGLRDIDPATGMQKRYLVKPDEQRSHFVRPVRGSYRHNTCGSTTSMARAIAETYAADPTFYQATMCVACGSHYPVSEFTWLDDGTMVGS